MWINANTLVVYNYIYEIRQAFPETSFPEFPNDSDFEPFDVYPVVQTPVPEYDWVTQGVQEVTPVKTDGVWYQTWEVYDLTPEQIAANKESIRQSNKAQASSLLQATDWTCTVDINNPQYSNPYLGNQDAFLSYRSQVRQIAVNPPDTPAVFPEVPNEVWITV